MNKTKIDWCDCTINAVVGCKNKCPYCYARKINNRFHFIENWEEPQFFEERLKQLYSKSPKSIFMDSMSDIGWWKEEWKQKTFHAMLDNPQHTYIFLTKCNEIDVPYYLRQGKMKNRVFFGQSQTKGVVFNGFNNKYRDFLSIEPLLDEVHFNGFGGIRQVIIGAETGNRKEKIVPKKEWVDNIVKQCDSANVRVFMKESLRKIMGDDFRQDSLIWEVT